MYKQLRSYILFVFFFTPQILIANESQTSDDLTITIEPLSLAGKPALENPSTEKLDTSEPIQISFEFETTNQTPKEEWNVLTKATQVIATDAKNSDHSYNAYKDRVDALISIIQKLTQLDSFKGTLGISIGENAKTPQEEITKNTSLQEKVCIAFEFKKNDQTDLTSWSNIASNAREIAKKSQNSDNTFQSFVTRVESLIDLIKKILKLNAFEGAITVDVEKNTSRACDNEDNNKIATLPNVSSKDQDDIQKITVLIEAAQKDGYTQEEWNQLVKHFQDLVVIIKSDHKFSGNLRQLLLEQGIETILKKSFNYGVALE